MGVQLEQDTISSFPCGLTPFFKDCKPTGIRTKNPGEEVSIESILASINGGCCCQLRAGIDSIEAELEPWQFPIRTEEAMQRLSFDWINPPSSQERPDNNIFVSIFGPWAAGKTTLARLSEELCQERGVGCVILDEAFLENPVLPELNTKKGQLAQRPKDRNLRKQVQGLAWESEQYFLEEDRQQIRAVQSLLSEDQGRVIIQAADLHVDPTYALGYQLQGLMTRASLKNYLSEFSQIESRMPVPDLVLGIEVSPAALVLRLKLRVQKDFERDFEREVPSVEVALIAHIAHRSLQRLEDQRWPVVRLDTDNLDYTQGNGRKKAAELLANSLGEIAYLKDIPIIARAFE